MSDLKEKYLKQLENVTKRKSYGLIKEIKQVFSTGKYPENEFISGSAEINQDSWEFRECHEYFVGKKWEDCLDEKSYRKLIGGQSYFNTKAWHYYLPAYLIQSIKNKKFSFLHFKEFTDEDLPEVIAWHKEKIQLLSSKQCKVVIQYLEITLEVWKDIEKGYEDDLETLKFWQKNYQNALLKETPNETSENR